MISSHMNLSLKIIHECVFLYFHFDSIPLGIAEVLDNDFTCNNVDL